ncbi:22324_t:CDS:2, partial [Entrophospora sp. SA101]
AENESTFSLNKGGERDEWEIRVVREEEIVEGESGGGGALTIGIKNKHNKRVINVEFNTKHHEHYVWRFHAFSGNRDLNFFEYGICTGKSSS